jgi:hypothetical protein
VSTDDLSIRGSIVKVQARPTSMRPATGIQRQPPHLENRSSVGQHGARKACDRTYHRCDGSMIYIAPHDTMSTGPGRATSAAGRPRATLWPDGMFTGAPPGTGAPSGQAQ